MGEALDTVRRMLAAFEAADDAAMRALLTEDVVLQAPGGVRLTGRERVADYGAAFLAAFDGLEFDTHVLAEQGVMVVEEYTLRGTHARVFTTPAGDALPPTGRRMSLRVVEVYRVQGGLIAENRFYFDPTELYRQLAPAAPAAPPAPATPPPAR